MPAIQCSFYSAIPGYSDGTSVVYMNHSVAIGTDDANVLKTTSIFQQMSTIRWFDLFLLHLVLTLLCRPVARPTKMGLHM